MLNVEIIKKIKKNDPKSHELVKLVFYINRSEASQIKRL